MCFSRNSNICTCQPRARIRSESGLRSAMATSRSMSGARRRALQDASARCMAAVFCAVPRRSMSPHVDLYSSSSALATSCSSTVLSPSKVANTSASWRAIVMPLSDM